MLPAAVTGATTVTGVTLYCDDWTTWPGELVMQTSPVGVTTVELEVDVTWCFAVPLPRCLPLPWRAACDVVVIVVTVFEPQTELVSTCCVWVAVQAAGLYLRSAGTFLPLSPS